VNAREKCDLICANLVSNLLLEQRERIVGRLDRDGILIVAGILRTEFGSVRRAFSQAGLTLSRSQAEGEWESGVFAFANQPAAC